MLKKNIINWIKNKKKRRLLNKYFSFNKDMFFDLKNQKYDVIEIINYDKLVEFCILYDTNLLFIKKEENYYFYLFSTTNMENFFFRQGIFDEKENIFISLKYNVVYFNINEKEFKNILLKKGSLDD